MKAMILAAGFGLRLLPLTNYIPKSMLPISNIPLLAYLIRYLKKAKIEEIVINLHHLPNKIIDYCKDGSPLGIKITYSLEKDILGTAGGIKAAAPLLMDDPFFVINSDIAFELDFSDVIKFHKKNNALITMVLREDQQVEKYGIIEIDKSYRVRNFLNSEIPKKGLKLKKTMFTGISLFDPKVLKEFPDKGFCDIAKEIYPKLLKKNYPIFGFLTKNYWMDMGTPKNYIHLQKDILSERVFKKIMNDRQNVNLSNRFENVNIVPPVIIGENVELNKNTSIGPYATIGRNCIINKDCSLKNSIIWDNIIIPEYSKIENSIAYGEKNILKV